MALEDDPVQGGADTQAQRPGGVVMRTLSTGIEEKPFAIEAILNLQCYFEGIGDLESLAYFKQREREVRRLLFKRTQLPEAA